ncbi:hypothetical protein AXG93_3491s1160 [Marchantia polymorpha subsp. ruderalis]|uniref:Retrovirus-related Pol polyprotein from transposon TNT 1-94 n=1 Tax=Marchantia polymorpha subsp. ruderalis TaxID=1480154 RepID=A0A176VQN1_MARPO|nr:hypothetical protein AXG93_3491s1160 [Marchantia polymorpha subsp. ruderalis]
MKVVDIKFEIAKYDGRMDYLLWERQVKGMMKAIGSGKLLKTKPEDVPGEDWNDMQEMALMSFKMKYGITKVQDHIDVFNDLVLELQSLDEELSDERKTLHLLSSLPLSYKKLSQVLLHQDIRTITYNEVVSVLKTDELQQKMMQQFLSSTSSGVALNVNRGRSQKRTTDGNKQKFRSKSQ